MEEFNHKYAHKLIWVPWQRPGFELAMMIREAVKRVPAVTASFLAGTGYLPGVTTQRECYVNTITIIDQLGQFVSDHLEHRGAKLFGGSGAPVLENHLALAQDVFPLIRAAYQPSSG